MVSIDMVVSRLWRNRTVFSSRRFCVTRIWRKDSSVADEIAFRAKTVDDILNSVEEVNDVCDLFSSQR